MAHIDSVYGVRRPSRADELFPTDRPVPEAMIGRGDEVKALAASLDQGINRLVVGPRRQGKTTLCRAALGALRRQGAYTVDVDLFVLVDLRRFAEALVDGAIANRSALRRAARGAANAGRAGLSALSVVATARLRAELGESVELAFEPAAARRDPWRHFEHALRLLQRIAEVDGRHLVLFIDEFQQIGAAHQPFGEPDQVMTLMRGILQDSPSVTTVFAGSVEHVLRDLLAPPHRAFHQWGSWYELQPVDEATWREGLARRLAGTDVSFDPAALHRLVELGERHARTTMLLAQQAWYATVSEHRDVIDAGAVEAGLAMATAADGAAHEITLAYIRQAGRHTLAVAVAVAAGDPPYTVASPRTVQRALDALRTEGVVERRGPIGRGGWVVPDPLLRRFLARLEP